MYMNSKNLALGISRRRWGRCLAVSTVLCTFHCTPDTVQKPVVREVAAEYRPLPKWAQDPQKHLLKKPIELAGEMRCGNHSPAHLALSYAEAKELSERFGCINWEFMGTITGNGSGREAGLNAR